MKRKIVIIGILCMLLLSGFIGMLNFENAGVDAKTLYVGGSGKGNYTKIQTAINNASVGDTVYVYTGLYNESLVINKKINLIGGGANNTIINGKGSGDVIFVNASGVVISGFTIKNGGKGDWDAGIELHKVEDCSIINNNISSNGDIGIFVRHSYNITIKNNLISQNKWHGIYFYLSRNNSFVNNTLIKNNLKLYASKHNSIENNELYGPSKLEDMDAIKLHYDSAHNKIVNNYITNWTGNGIYVHYSGNNNISDNVIHNTCNESWSIYDEQSAISLLASRENIISRNSITDNNGCGISFYYSSNNLIIYNKVSGNPTGIWGSSNEVWNIIYLNDFVNNNKSTGDISSYNLWNSTLPMSFVYKGENYTSYLGNYWDDYTGNDSDGNGIGDTPYNITQTPLNKDYFPLVDVIDNYTLIPSTTKIELVETCSNSTNITVALKIQSTKMDAAISGILSGIVNVTKLHIFIINSSFFAGFGFFKAVFRAVIEEKVYEGHWEGMLFNKTGERKIYLKGTVSGDLRGITDGYFTESTNGSGVYDVYNSTWTISHLGKDLTFAELFVNGTVHYKTSKNDKSEIYILQGNFQGNATGYYNKSFGLVLLHIRMNNKTKEYYGYGFTMISYNCAYGSGTGYTIDKSESTYITNLKGFFTEPLWGLITGILDESGSKRKLTIILERIDIGLPPKPILIINVWGPWRASPGQKINYCLEYKNIGLKSAKNTEIIMTLPNNTTYISHTCDGKYNSTNHEVIWWRNISAKSRDVLCVKVKIQWGLSWGTKLVCNGSIKDYVANKTLAIDSYTTRITPARDPNIKYGPDGNVTAGQKLDYKIEFENVGKGIAYGVYFTDELNKNLDDSTLKIGPVISTSNGKIIAPAGNYNPSTRVITWFVGEVGPGAGGYAEISINVKDNVAVGTEIINYGTVYFPSVPEITRTNGIVSIVVANKWPVAIAESNRAVYTLQEIIFNGSSSFDPDGTITSYTWDFGDGRKGQGKVVSHTYWDDGEYLVTLTVKDDYDFTDTHKFSVQIVNRVPIAKFEVDSKDVETKEVIFNAEKSFDVDGSVSEYNFDFGDGESSDWVQTPIVSHKYADRNKLYTVKLKVRDNDGETSRNKAELELKINEEPIPKLAVSPIEEYTYTDIIFTGELSSDTDGQISSYYFDFGDGEASGWISTASVSHQYTDGTKKYTVSLKVKDNYGAESSEISVSEILIKNRKPVPILKVSKLDIYVNAEVVFDASGTNDLDGAELEYYFDFGDGTNSGWITDLMIKHIYTLGPQDYSVELKVKDSDGEINSTVLLITVNNRIPVAIAGPDQFVEVNQAVSFDGSASTDPEDAVLSYKWDFGDATTSGWVNTAKTTHSFSQPGEYTVTLTVSDGTLTAKDTCSVIVEPPLPKDSDGDGVPDIDDAFPDDEAASVDTDGDQYPDSWNPGKSGKDSTTGLELDDYPDNPDKHEESKRTARPSENIYLMSIIIISIIILIIGIVASILRKNKKKLIRKPFDSDELIRKVRDEIISGDVKPEHEDSDNELWSNLEMKYKNGQISEETYKLLEQEKLDHDSELND